jgi:hypothetical protein
MLPGPYAAMSANGQVYHWPTTEEEKGEPMNRRQALAALVSLPPTARVSVATLQADDVIIVECEDHLSQDTAIRLRAELIQVWPQHKIVVLDRGMRIKIAAASATGGGCDK